jgi:FKBP-type peptidyl-prolyl cis-trans isomerase (trigger factor)
LGVEVGFTGTKKGVFYLLGNPEFDSKTGHLKLKNVEYDIATKNVLIKSAKWLLDETIRKKLEEQMDFDMSALVQDTKKSINESLNQKMDYGVQLKGLLTSLDIVGWDINSKNLVVRSKIKGDLQVVIN